MDDSNLMSLVPMLSGVDNYLLWSVKFKAWAASKGLGDLLVRTEDPSDADIATDTEDVKEATLKRQLAHAKLDAQSLGGMTLRLADSKLHLALEAKTARQL